MESSSDFECTPPEITEAAKKTSLKLLPAKSSLRYEYAYDQFIKWRQRKQIKSSFSENVLLAYMDELSSKVQSSTLWTQYSMLRTTLSVQHNVDISKYPKLKVFLKRKSDGYKPKKAKVLSQHEINNFIETAPDELHLFTKVALILGISGACRKQELTQLTINDIEDLGTAAVIKIDNTKNQVSRKFTITGQFYTIFKKYANLRPPTTQLRFFLNYKNEKCTQQAVGINKIGSVPKIVAKFLNLPNPEQYTGHTFRRSSATILVDAGADLAALKRHGGWKSSTVAEQYIDDSATNRLITANKIMNAISSTSTFNEEVAYRNTEQYSDNIEQNVEQNAEQHTETTQPRHSAILCTSTIQQQIHADPQKTINTYISDTTDNNNATLQNPLQFSGCYNNAFTFNFYNVPEKK